MLTTELLWNEDAFRQLEPVWDNLARGSMTDTPFQTWAYQKAWWRHLSPADLMTISVRDESGEIVGIAPFFNKDGVLHFNGCVDETDYLDLICKADVAEAVWTTVLDCLCNLEDIEWHALDLCNVPEASPTREILPQLAERWGFSFATEVQEVCPVINLPNDFEDYLAELDKKQRHEIRRKMRRAQGAGAYLRVISAEDDIQTEVDRFLELMQKSTFEKGAWLTEARAAVFHEVAAAALEAGTLQMLFFVVNDYPAAALFNFDYEGRIWVYNSGLDPEAFGHLSAGVVLSSWAIEKAVEDGRQVFDFLRGNETYKYRFGAVDTTIHRIQIGRGS